MLASSDVQAAQDLAAVAHAATLECRVPFLHFFDGFRTSHEVNVITPLDDDGAARRSSTTTSSGRIASVPCPPTTRCSAGPRRTPTSSSRPARPPTRSTRSSRRSSSGRWTGSPSSRAAPTTCSTTRARPTPSGSSWSWDPGNGAVEETVDALDRRAARRSASSTSASSGRSRPDAFAAALPPSVRSIAVLDRTKEPGSRRRAAVPGRRDGARRARRDRRPAVDAAGHRRPVRPVLEGVRPGDGQGRLRRAREGAAEEPLHGRDRRRRLAHVPGRRPRRSPPRRTTSCGPSSTASAPTAPSSANKNSVKIIGEGTDLYAQGYFVYDSKKSGAMTTSHLRFGPHPIRSSYLIGSGRRTSSPATSSTSSSGRTCSTSRRRARRSC